MKKIEIINGERRDYSKPLPENITEWRWVEVVNKPKPEFDMKTRFLEVKESLTEEGFVREYIIVDKTPEVIKQEHASQIKQDAQNLIIQIAPEWKQRNMIAYSVEMLEKMMQGYKPTEEDIAKMNIIRSTWATIQQIRTISDKKEAGEEIDFPKLEKDGIRI